MCRENLGAYMGFKPNSGSKTESWTPADHMRGDTTINKGIYGSKNRAILIVCNFLVNFGFINGSFQNRGDILHPIFQVILT